MRVVNDQRIRDFTKMVCEGILSLDFKNPREGQLITKATVEVSDSNGNQTKQELRFFVSAQFIRVQANLIKEDKLYPGAPINVYEMVDDEPDDRHREEETLNAMCGGINSSESPIEDPFQRHFLSNQGELSIAQQEMFERVYNLALLALGVK